MQPGTNSGGKGSLCSTGKDELFVKPSEIIHHAWPLTEWSHFVCTLESRASK